MYVIIGKYGGEEEELDRIGNVEEAEYLVEEYRMAFGSDWDIWFEKEN